MWVFWRCCMVMARPLWFDRFLRPGVLWVLLVIHLWVNSLIRLFPKNRGVILENKGEEWEHNGHLKGREGSYTQAMTWESWVMPPSKTQRPRRSLVPFQPLHSAFNRTNPRGKPWPKSPDAVTAPHNRNPMNMLWKSDSSINSVTNIPWAQKGRSIAYSEYWELKVKVSVAQPWPILCNPMDCSPPGSSVHGILQARALEWVAIPFSRGSSQLKDQTWVFCISGRLFTIWTTREAHWELALLNNWVPKLQRRVKKIPVLKRTGSLSEKLLQPSQMSAGEKIYKHTMVQR